ncbi:MAG: LLM class flavin-dependent oxidoreductase [Anaerolineae bacterium]|nr:LLM class flavin-dependent oxidoreductase [Anaerolineae bacterium]
MAIRLGMGLFWVDQTYRDYVALVEACEALGYDTLWATNEKFFRDMYVTATVAAEHSTRAKIGTFVADPYSHHPALTASAIGTLDEVSGGRAILCIGAGGTGFPAMGIKRAKPAQAIKEAVLVIRGLLRGETVDMQGEVIQFYHGRLNFKPRPDIPIYVATRGDLVLQTAGEVADGVMIATYAEPVGIKHALSMVEKGAQLAGRSLSDLRIISRVDACISKDRRAAIEAVKPMAGVFLWTSYPDRGFVRCVGLDVPDELEAIIAKRDYNLMAENAHLIPDEFVEKFCWAGTAEDVAQKVAAVAQMGIKDITFLPHPPAGGDVSETMRAFAQTVKPLVDEMIP